MARRDLPESPRVVASVEARMRASRLPGKMLEDLNGRPVLLRVLERLARAETLDAVIVATTDDPADAPLAALAEEAGYLVHRGSEADVLQRVVDAQQAMGADVAVEICGDCPVLDPALVDLTIDSFFANECDVAACGARQSYPQGTEVQVFAVAALADVAARVDDPAAREHVARYFHEHPERYDILHLVAPRALQAPDLRLQLDYPEDLTLLRHLYEELEPACGPAFGVADILALLRDRPDLAEINAHCEERAVR